MRPKLKHTFNAVIYPCHDIPGQWGAHCLELDIVSQGNSAPHALEMIPEAIKMTAEANIAEGLAPYQFRSAPAEDWEGLTGADELASRILQIEARSYSDEVTVSPVLRSAARNLIRALA